MRTFTLLTIIMTVCFAFSGCSNSGNQDSGTGADVKSSSTKSTTMSSPPPTIVDNHVHPTEGPHHGSLIELGNEEFHAELVHDETSVTIYILDSAAKIAVPVDAQEVAINLVHDGKPEQFKLAAQPDSGDPAGKSSRFVAENKELVEELEHDHGNSKLTVLINGKSYRGDIQHNHHHSGHDHAGHDH